jgi:hypothetical protein
MTTHHPAPLARTSRTIALLTLGLLLAAPGCVAVKTVSVEGAAASSPAAAPRLADPEATGRDLAQRFFDLLASEDNVAALDAFLSPAFQICRADGSFANKREYLANPARVGTFRIARDGFRAYQDGPVLTVRFLIDIDETIDGGRVRALRAVRTGTFLFEEGAWRLVSWCNFNPVPR